MTTDVAVYFRAMCVVLVNEEALGKSWKAVKTMCLNFVQNAFCGRICHLRETTPNAITCHNCPYAYHIYLEGISGIMIMDGGPRSTSKKHKVFYEKAFLEVV